MWLTLGPVGYEHSFCTFQVWLRRAQTTAEYPLCGAARLVGSISM